MTGPRSSIGRNALSGWRSFGGDLPWHDPGGAHGAQMEGYYWRLVTDDGRVIIALCGVSEHTEALVALATGPDSVRWTSDRPVALDSSRLGIIAGDLIRASASRLSVVLPGAGRLDARFIGGEWPHRLTGLGLAGMLPGLTQYWHPHRLGARVDGVLTLGGRTEPIAGTVYAEKNWGSGFPRRWWWGQAHDDEVTVAFAGGTVGVSPVGLRATAVVVATTARIIRFVAPLAVVTTQASGDARLVRARGPLHRVTIEAAPGTEPPMRLPVPRGVGAAPGQVRQFARATMRVRLWRGRRLLLDRELTPAGLESGTATDRSAATR